MYPRVHKLTDRLMHIPKLKQQLHSARHVKYHLEEKQWSLKTGREVYWSILHSRKKKKTKNPVFLSLISWFVFRGNYFCFFLSYLFAYPLFAEFINNCISTQTYSDISLKYLESDLFICLREDIIIANLFYIQTNSVEFVTGKCLVANEKKRGRNIT